MNENYLFDVDRRNRKNYNLRKSLISNISGCLVIKAKVTVLDNRKVKSVIVYTSGCSINLKRNKKRVFEKVIQSAKIKGYSKIIRNTTENISDRVRKTVANTNLYAKVLKDNNVIVQILDYRFRYFTRKLNIKTVNRGGKRYNYVFKNNGQIKTYSRMRYFKDIRNYR